MTRALPLWLGLLAAPVALASEPGPEELRAWSATGVELQPDQYGDTGVRALERLGVDVTFEDGWQILADGGLRVRRSPYEPLEFDLYRLAATQRGSNYTLALGRHVRLDARGYQRIDGVSVEVRTPTPVTASLWAGRLWHPATWEGGTTMVTGGQIHLNPLVDGVPSKLTRFSLGYEARAHDTGFLNRLFFAAAAGTPRGVRGLAFFEIQPRAEDIDIRVNLHGNAPLGRTVDLGVDLRWEDERPDAWPEGVRTALDWLAPDGYGLASVELRWFGGPFALSVRGGPSLNPRKHVEEGEEEYELSLGGIGRGGLTWTDGDAVTFGLFGGGAGVDGSWYGGGGAEVTWDTDFLWANADIGLYAFQGIDGARTPIWEARIRGKVPIWHAEDNGLSRSLAIGLEGATGIDRQLVGWVRGGVSLDAHIGKGAHR